MAIVGIDYGARRIGIAVSDSGVLATPHSVLANEGDVVAKIDALGRELGAETFVVGVARRPSGGGEQRFHDFAGRLRQRTCKPVVLWNEALSTVEASARLREAGRNRRDAEREIDMHAAAVILQSYLDDLSRRTP
ncbi:MAG: Holliday junction resolvase RuvX [Thermoanaerobaculia bacterium]